MKMTDARERCEMRAARAEERASRAEARAERCESSRCEREPIEIVSLKDEPRIRL